MLKKKELAFCFETGFIQFTLLDEKFAMVERGPRSDSENFQATSMHDCCNSTKENTELGC